MRINEPVTQRDMGMNKDRPIISTTNLKGVLTSANKDFIRMSGYTWGGLGNDVIFAGLGTDDQYLFDTTPGATNVDQINGFFAGSNTIEWLLQTGTCKFQSSKFSCQCQSLLPILQKIGISRIDWYRYSPPALPLQYCLATKSFQNNMDFSIEIWSYLPIDIYRTAFSI